MHRLLIFFPGVLTSCLKYAQKGFFAPLGIIKRGDTDDPSIEVDLPSSHGVSHIHLSKMQNHMYMLRPDLEPGPF